MEKNGQKTQISLLTKIRNVLGSSFWPILVMICALAAVTGYKVSFSLFDGFKFQPSVSDEDIELDGDVNISPLGGDPTTPPSPND